MRRRTRRIITVSVSAVVAGPLAVMAAPSPSVTAGPVTYSVTLDGGDFDSVDLAIHSATLVDCEPETSWFEGLRSVMGSMSGAHSAVAGHSGDEDPAAVTGRWIVGTEGGEVVLGSATLDEAAYCDVHLAFANRAPGESVNTGPTVVAEIDGSTYRTETSWGVVIALTDDIGSPLQLTPGAPASIDVALSIGDLQPSAEEALDPVDILRAIVANSSATA